MNISRIAGSVSALAAALVVAGATGLAYSTARAEPAATQPAPEEASTVTPAPTEPDAPPIERIEKALRAFTPTEQAILDDVRNTPMKVRPSGRSWPQPEDRKDFYILMGKVADLPPLKDADYYDLDRPAYRSFMQEPNRWFGRPMRMTVLVFQVEKLTVDNGKLNASIFWRKEAPIWKLYCLNAKAETPGLEPVTVYVPVDPTNILGQPPHKSDHGRMGYEVPGRRAEIAGVFLRNYQDVNRGGVDGRPTVREFPAVLAWQIAPPTEWEKKTNAFSESHFILLLLAGFLILFLLMRARMARNRREQPDTWESRHPMREADRMEEGDAEPPEEEEPGPVDPQLAAAAKQYRKEKGIDEPDHTS